MSIDLAALTREILARCDALAACSEEPDRLTRTFLRQPMHETHYLLTEWMNAAGLVVRRDALGNLIGRRASTSEAARLFLIGSHVDTVPNAGKYDGILGVLLGIAAMTALGERRFAQTVDVIAFSEEEGVRFGTPYLGSSAICGCFEPGWLEKKDAEGVTLVQAMLDFGLNPAAISLAAYAPGAVSGYVEVHIEQGPVLESRGSSVGIVDAIVGQSRRRLKFVGQAGHAGTQPMELRRDALAAAAEFVAIVEQTALATQGLRATVGQLLVEPGAVNVVPGQATVGLDVRHADDAIRERSVAELIEEAKAIAAKRSLAVEISPLLDQPAVPVDMALTGRLADAVKKSGQADFRLPSGAGHDAVMMATICPIAMLFVRSPGGISHHPDESVHPHDVQIALEILVRFLEAELEMP